MKLILLCIPFLLTGLHPLQAQVHINFGVDTTHIEVKAALKLYNAYLGEFKSSDTGKMLEYWSDEEKAMRRNPDQ